MRRLMLSTLAGLLLCGGWPAHADEPTLADDDQKSIYVLGFALSREVGQFDLNPAELDIMISGLRDALAGKPPRAELVKYGKRITDLLGRRRTALAAKEQQASKDFLKQAAAEPGAVSLPSGLVFRETLAGKGMTPGATDVVNVHYHGTLRDGNVFDSSKDRGEPAQFPVDKVIACWTEALQKMREGGKATITCPAEIAYKDQGSGMIKPGAALRFDVELISIQQ